ncbi:hypothetical protein [Candidatus Protochlamydia phocaeensis]|uniref:hypothetical protein n=1 Tax=Candidatus Protochlamydia phocaeensis TaxID=1414722 RepID=UPI00083992FF|nr:hypothetical protein [Candidatus Protochlamydia phocaeensis]
MKSLSTRLDRLEREIKGDLAYIAYTLTDEDQETQRQRAWDNYLANGSNAHAMRRMFVAIREIP